MKTYLVIFICLALLIMLYRLKDSLASDNLRSSMSIVNIVNENPIADKTKTFGPDWSRNIIFKKSGSGDELYNSIVSKLKDSSVTRGAVITSNMSGNTFLLEDSDFKPYDVSSIDKKVSFSFPNLEEAITVYNGMNYVLIGIDKW